MSQLLLLLPPHTHPGRGGVSPTPAATSTECPLPSLPGHLGCCACPGRTEVHGSSLPSAECLWCHCCCFQAQGLHWLVNRFLCAMFGESRDRTPAEAGLACRSTSGIFLRSLGRIFLHLTLGTFALFFSSSRLRRVCTARAFVPYFHLLFVKVS